SGGSGDADLHIRAGSQPTSESYECRPWKNGNNETCAINNPVIGTWNIGINAYDSFSGVSLTATATE
ncbi:MAG: PPC domain-containing protein, partial [Psychrosphaera sp.]|nr:PPC domain-containing protein [Psychrosphaera sp.]